MKKNGAKLLIPYVILLYIGAIFYAIDIVLLRNFSGDSIDNIVYILFIIGLVFTIIAFGIGVCNIVYAIINLARDVENPSKETLKIKLALIPWYVVNFLVWTVIMAPFLNPFLMIAVPIIMIIGICCTWCYMVISSVHNISYLVTLVRKGKLKFNAKVVIVGLLQFILCIDVIGALLQHLMTKNIE